MEKEKMSPAILLDLDTVAERLAVSRKMVYDWVREGKLPGVKLGRLWRVRERDLEAFIDALEPIKPGEERRTGEERRAGEDRRSNDSSDDS